MATKTALIVEDMESNRQLLGLILKNEGYHVDFATNGEEAVSYCQNNFPEFILMDIMMPVMDGIEATKIIKKHYGNHFVPIIFVTALSDENVLQKCIEAGGDDFLPKPISSLTLSAKIKSFSRIVRMQDTLNASLDRVKRYNKIIDNHVITSSTDLNGNITSVSNAFCRISQYTKHELLGKAHNIVRHPDMPKELYEDLWSTIKSGKKWRGEIKNRKKDGSYYWVNVNIEPNFTPNGEMYGYTAIRQDITDKKHIEDLYITDSLTQLYNRYKINETLDSELVRFERYNRPFSLIIIDIDHFKAVNDSYGHQVGDDVLVKVAKVIKSHIRATDIVGRWGGEEFLMICPETDLTSSSKLAEKIRLQIATYDFPVVGNKTASFGVACVNKNESKESLIKRADMALYKAKEEGRNKVTVSKEPLKDS